MNALNNKTILKRHRIYALPFLMHVILFFSIWFNSSVAMADINQNRVWYVLNHYNKDGISDIQNADYFVAKDGRTNPIGEYDAFVGILKKYMVDGSNANILCQFPARVTFFASTLDWFHEKDRPHCADYISDVNPEKISTISIMFASGYFDNPSSYYGHMLLKFNHDKKILNQGTLNSSLNYGADSGNEDGTLMYVLNGLFGGYQASYQRNNNFINSHRYTNGQLRDIWEYRLNLTPEQIKFVAEHSWELMRAKFTYYFFSDNCANRIADLIERATSTKLAYSHGFWILPIQVIEHAKDTKSDAGDLIASEEYHPSLKSTFTKRYEALSRDEKDAFLEFFKTSDTERRNIVSVLSEKVLVLILEELDITSAKSTIEKSKNKSDPELQEHRRIILSELLGRKSGYKISPLEWKKDNTLLNYKPVSVLRAGASRRGGKDYMSLQYQIANNDIFDTPIPAQEHSKVVMGNVQADMSDSGVQIRDVTLIDIMNLNTNPIPFWLTKEFSWQMRVAYDHRNPACSSCGSFGITGKAGQAVRLNDDWLIYTLAGVTLRHKQVDGFGYASLLSDSALLYSPDSFHTFKLGGNVIYDPLNDKTDGYLDAEYSYKFSEDKDIRLLYERSKDNETLLSVKFGYYFN